MQGMQQMQGFPARISKNTRAGEVCFKKDRPEKPCKPCLPCAGDEPGIVWLEGCLLATDRRRDRLLIGFVDMDLDEPVWLPAAEVRFEPYADGFGWGCFRLPAALAAQRAKLSARALAAKDRAAKPDRKPAVRRSKVFMPKTLKTAPPAHRQFELF
jgi:hypothetical protein